MKTKKKNRILPLIILLAVVAALAVGYKLLSDYNAKEAEKAGEAEDTTTVVLDKSDKTVTALSYNDGKNALSFTYVNDKWKYDGDEKYDSDYPVDQTKLAAMASAAQTVTAQTVVNSEDIQDTAAYGLDSPAMLVTAAFSDGSSYSYTFGTTNSFNSFQYFTLSGDDNIYMVNTTVASTYGASIEDLFGKEDFLLSKNTVTADMVTSIKVETATGQSNEITDTEAVKTLYNLVYKLDLSQWEDYYADDAEKLDKYGVGEGGDKITVTYNVQSDASDSSGSTVTASVPATYTIYVGLKYESAENENAETTATDTTAAADTAGYKYFYSPEGSTVVYGADGTTVDNIFAYLTYTPAETTGE